MLMSHGEAAREEVAREEDVLEKEEGCEEVELDDGGSKV